MQGLTRSCTAAQDVGLQQVTALGYTASARWQHSTAQHSTRVVAETGGGVQLCAAVVACAAGG
jgi:hypothetical protein